jgi:hypothetical protein
VLAYSLPTALLALRAYTTVLADSCTTALLALTAPTTVRTSAAHFALPARLHPVLARPLCWRGSLSLSALLRPITITRLDLHLELERSLGRDFGADTLEVGAPPRRHPPSAPHEVTRPS